eukprot:173151-Prorocentrum_minimum.AAC.1
MRRRSEGTTWVRSTRGDQRGRRGGEEGAKRGQRGVEEGESPHPDRRCMLRERGGGIEGALRGRRGDLSIKSRRP